MVAIVQDKKKEAKKLAQAVIHWSDEPLKDFRKLRKDTLRTFGGLLFAEDGDEEQILPIFHAMTSIFLPQLRVKPDPLVTTRKPMLRGFGSLTEIAIEFILQEIEYAKTLRLVTLEALYGRGITVCGVGDAPTMDLMEPNEEKRTFIRRVAEDDFIDDTAARNRPDQVTFRGHRFLAPYEEARDSGYYDPDVIKRIFERDKSLRGRNESKDGKPTHERFVDEVELATLWLPPDRLVTMAGNMEMADEYAREDEYTGPRVGPYNILNFLEMPDSSMPIPPMSVIYALQKVLNQVASKIHEQAIEQKDIIIVQAGQKTEMEAAMKARTGSIITGNAQGSGTFSMGGVNETNYRAAMWLREHLNQYGGSPNVIGGTEAQAPTLGQEQMLFSGASSIQVDRKARVLDFASRDCRNVAYYLWNDDGPLGRTMDLIQSLPAPIGDVPVRWKSDLRHGEYGDYVFKVKAYSALSDDPETQYKQVVRWLNDIIFPLSQIAASQGTIPNVSLIAEITGKWLEIEEAPEIFSEGGIPANAPTLSSSGAGKEGQQRAGTAQPGRLRTQTPVPSTGPPVGKGAAGS